MQYYIVVEEWLYPTESGREIIGDFDKTIGGMKSGGDETSLVLNRAKELADAEEQNFELACRTDCLPPAQYNNKNGGNANMSIDEIGYIITSKNGLDDWYYAVRIIPVSSLDTPFPSCSPLSEGRVI